MNHIQNCHRVAVQTVIRIGVADVLGYIAGYLLKINIGFCGKFAADEDKGGRCKGFAGYMTFRVFFQTCVQNSIGNLVTQFVGVTFAD